MHSAVGCLCHDPATLAHTQSDTAAAAAAAAAAAHVHQHNTTLYKTLTDILTEGSRCKRGLYFTNNYC